MFARMNSSRGGTLLIELLMIVVGINIALWFEGKAEEFGEREAEQQYLEGLSEDLETDIANLDELLRGNRNKVEVLQGIIPDLDTLADAPAARQAQVIFTPSSYLFFQPADFTYVSMQESGDFRLLSDPGTKRRLLRLVRRYQFIKDLQTNYMQAMDDQYIPLMMEKFNLVEGRITDPALLENQVFRNFFAFALQETEQRVQQMDRARTEAEELRDAIRAQLR